MKIIDPHDINRIGGGWWRKWRKGHREGYGVRLMWVYLIRNFEPFQQRHKFLLDVRLLNIKHFTSGRKLGKANPHELSCTTQAAKIAASRGGG